MFSKKFILLLLVNIFLIISIRAIPHHKFLEFAKVDVDIYDYENDDSAILVEVIDVVGVDNSNENDGNFEDLEISPSLEDSMITGYPIAENEDNPLANIFTGISCVMVSLIILLVITIIGWCICIRRRKRQMPSAIMSEYHYVPSTSYNDDEKKSVIDVQNYEYKDDNDKGDDGNINNSKSSVIDNITSTTISDNTTNASTTTTTATTDISNDNNFITTAIDSNASMRAIYGESYNSSNNNTNSTLNDQTNETTVFDEPSESLPSSPTTPLDLHLSSSIDADITTTQSTPNNFNLAANPTSTIFNTKSNKNISEQNPQIKFLIGVGAGVVLIVIAGLAFFFVNLKRRNSSNNGKTIQQLKRSTSKSTGFIESESLPKPKSVDLSTSITITQQKDESEKIPDLSSTSDSGVSDIPLQINPIGSPREHSSPIYSGRNSPYHSPSHSGDQLDKTLYLESIGTFSQRSW
ncbi:6217_t:CDS:2 [Entrophospora sp. SA101]|nr:6217_t:CDS:2 [Entrophospora sp. SA101]